MNNYITKIAIVALALNTVSCQSDVPDLQSDIANNQATQIMSRSSSGNYFSDGWQNLDSQDEKVAALQLPENLLKSMSTDELVEACLSYPLALDCFAFNDVNSGIQMVISDFNGFAELKTRSDAFDKVLDFYSRKLDEIELLGNSVGYVFEPLNLSFYERFIVSGFFPEEIINNSQKLKLLIGKAVSLRELYPNLQGHVATETLKSLQSSIGTNRPQRTPISMNFQLIQTPGGLPVLARCFVCYNPESDRQEGINYIRNSRHKAVILDDATCTYNCHAYAWYVSEGGERLWINHYEDNVDNISQFINDGTYKETTKQYAQKASYISDDHSAIVEQSGNYFVSKWGALPLVRHHWNDSPYNSSNIKYYTKDFSAPSPDDPNPVDPDPVNPENPDSILTDPEFKTGTVIWNMTPDPTPVNSYEDFSISDIYDTQYYRVDVFISTAKDPSVPMTDTSLAYIVSSTDRTATVYFAARGIYHVCFYVYNKTTGKCIAQYTSNEIYVAPPTVKVKRNKQGEIEL